MIRRKKHSNQKQRGQGLVEFALALPVFLLAVMGVIELSRFFLVYSSVYTASREAARYATSVGLTAGGVTHDQDCAGIEQIAIDTGVFAGITADQVTVTYETNPGDTARACGTPTNLGDRVVVRVEAQFEPIAGVIPAMPVVATNGRTIMKDIDIYGTPPPTPEAATAVPYPPTVDAGPDQYIEPVNFPVTVNLNGTVWVQGSEVTPPQVSVTWSGPGTFSDPGAIDPTVSFDSPGDYTLMLSAAHGTFGDTDTVTIRLSPLNTAPVVTANLAPGEPETIQVNELVNINATAVDDGLPSNPGALTYGWTIECVGTGCTSDADFHNASALNTTVSFSLPGHYRVVFSASDGQLTSSASFEVHVNPITDVQPIVNAGPDQVIEPSAFPITAVLDATVWLHQASVDPPAVSVTWSGPGSFTNANAVDTTVVFNAPTDASALYTDYALTLTAVNVAESGTYTDSDEIVIRVYKLNEAPRVSAYANVNSVSLGESVSLHATVNDDGLPLDPGSVAKQWTAACVGEGCTGTVQFSNPTGLDTSAVFSEPGNYAINFTASDGLLSSSLVEPILIAVNPALPEESCNGYNLWINTQSVVTNANRYSFDVVNRNAASGTNFTLVAVHNLTWSSVRPDLPAMLYSVYWNGSPAWMGELPSGQNFDVGSGNNQLMSYLDYTVSGLQQKEMMFEFSSSQYYNVRYSLIFQIDNSQDVCVLDLY